MKMKSWIKRYYYQIFIVTIISFCVYLKFVIFDIINDIFINKTLLINKITIVIH